MSAHSVETAVVIVNYRTKELTRQAASSVLGEAGVAELVIVDNGSADGSIEFLERELGDPRVVVVESPENVGFARGVNLGVQKCAAPLVLVLNSDATLAPGSLDRLRRTLLADESVAVVAPAVYAENGELQSGAYGSFPTIASVLWRRRATPGETVSPDWVSGVAMLMRRRDFESVGGFDPDFVMYLEDVDLCRRFRAAGREIRRDPSAAARHLVAQSWASCGAPHDWLHQSRVHYFRKAGASRASRLAVEALRIAYFATRRSPGRWAASQRAPR
jgi:GT2 family glycosyltransferase